MSNNCKLCQGKTKFLFKSYNKHGRHQLDIKEKFDVRECINCGVVFINGIEVNSNYYEKNYKLGYYDKGEKGNVLIMGILKVMRDYSMNRKEKIIRSSFKNKRSIKILDIGCGSGDFLASLKWPKFQKYGLEINKEGQELCKRKGIKVFPDEITNIDFKDLRFDVITMWHVLEHINLPDELFSKVNKILSKDGKLIIQTPNTESIGFKHGGREWFHLDSPRHLFLYNRKAIQTIAEKNGFILTKVVDEFYDYPLDLFWSLVGQNHIRYFSLFMKFFSRENLTYVFEKDV